MTGCSAGPVTGSGERVVVAGVAIDPLTENQVVQHVVRALAAGRGGHIVTPNVDICRQVAGSARLARLLAEAELVLADGMPLVWAARIQRRPLPERVTGADLIWSLSKAAARHGHPIYLLGGPPGIAEQAAGQLTALHPRLKVAGVDAPPYGFERSEEGLARVREALVAVKPELVFVGLGFPKQEQVIANLRGDLPGAWFLGCGSAIAFAAGATARAPEWMQETGLEWLFRLGGEPGRLARRYLLDDLPFAARMLVRAALARR
ncbi:WecB/TagA/CpsF family glycosyltransferase [Nonomuraea sp. NPDC050328]|uniref:WecB/TagA/CpsF family glycosyltransferase n=1 Tax=Nonomuraea sp. NPDC050328 TaxID=3364361 RepID=UPI0037977F1B